MKTVEYSIPLVITSGTNATEKTVALPAGMIVGVHASYEALNNPEMVRTSIKDFSGFELSRMQSVKNYVQRAGGNYLESIKPMPTNGGSNFTVTVQATANFTADTYIDMVFVYQVL